MMQKMGIVFDTHLCCMLHRLLLEDIESAESWVASIEQ